MNYIKIRGARMHNLKNISLDLPRGQLVVITGVSGSGKSSLAFDTLYAEGQRRYVESLSSYARQFLGIMDKADVDKIEGLSPAISIDQRSKGHNPRSTVGTVTEIYDYLRLLFARAGEPHCPQCGKRVKAQTIDEIYQQIIDLSKGRRIILLAPLVQNKKGEHQRELREMQKAGFVRLRLDDVIMEIDEALEKRIDKNKRHSLEIVVDRLKVSSSALSRDFKMRLMNSLETALDLGNGLVIVQLLQKNGTQDLVFSQHFACDYCKINLPEFEPRSFSFNSPYGACPHCSGLGIIQKIDQDLIIPNKNLSINEGAVRPWVRRLAESSWRKPLLRALAKKYRFSLDSPIKKLAPEVLKIILYGTRAKLSVSIKDRQGNLQVELAYPGVIPDLERRYQETHSRYIKREIESYMRKKRCSHCLGKRLRRESLAVLFNKKNIIEITEMDIEKCFRFFKKIYLQFKQARGELLIAQPIVEEIVKRLNFLKNVGLEYLTLARSAVTLSGGEAQRIKLAAQIGSQLSGVLYILDEPSVGLHARDNHKLINSLKALRDQQNSVVVVEHDEDMIRSADFLIDMGPGAGKQGGEIVALGRVKDIESNPASLTGQFLSGKKRIEMPMDLRQPRKGKIEILGAKEFNLKNIDIKIPLGCFVCITGVSGSGKSTLIERILIRALKQKLYQAKALPGKYQEIKGMELIDKVVSIDQSPIGRTPRSNPATYTGIFTPIRKLFAATTEARIRGCKPGRFSFNVRGGRCEACKGEGEVKVEMHFLPDVYVKCTECKGKRYSQEALEIYYKEKNIYDVLRMTVDEAYRFFSALPQIRRRLKVLQEVGLGYLELGQPATTLSGGEAQRIKLATELARRATGCSLYFLDEPTIGLHFADVQRLLKVVQSLVDKGNTVLVIEHNLEVIKCADFIIDLGPEGGDKGGYIIAQGTPLEVAQVKQSYTGQWLKRMIKS